MAAVTRRIRACFVFIDNLIQNASALSLSVLDILDVPTLHSKAKLSPVADIPYEFG